MIAAEEDKAFSGGPCPADAERHEQATLLRPALECTESPEDRGLLALAISPAVPWQKKDDRKRVFEPVSCKELPRPWNVDESKGVLRFDQECGKAYRRGWCRHCPVQKAALWISWTEFRPGCVSLEACMNEYIRLERERVAERTRKHTAELGISRRACRARRGCLCLPPSVDAVACASLSASFQRDGTSNGIRTCASPSELP